MKKLTRILAVAALMMTAILPTVRSFAIAEPNSDPQIRAVFAYDLPGGGLGVLIDYFLDYTSLPTETATESFLGVFVDTDGVTQLKAVAPYTFVSSGYGRGLIWIEFTAAEVTSYGLTSTNQALYRIRLDGNPTLTWTPGPTAPSTTATIDQWSSTSSILGARILSYADILELAWSLDMVEATSLGNRLTTTGANYFVNVIPTIQSLAPNVFNSSTTNPTPEAIDYTASFGATLTSSVVAGSPVTLTSGTNNLNTTGAGTLTFTLTKGTVGTVTGGVIAGSPAEIVEGSNAVTASGAGAFTVDVSLSTPQTSIDTGASGTLTDTSASANKLGLSSKMLSGVIWFILGIVLVALVFRNRNQGGYNVDNKGMLLIFGLWMLIGWPIGMVDFIVMAVIVLACALFIILQLVGKQANY